MTCMLERTVCCDMNEYPSCECKPPALPHPGFVLYPVPMVVTCYSEVNMNSDSQTVTIAPRADSDDEEPETVPMPVITGVSPPCRVCFHSCC